MTLARPVVLRLQNTHRATYFPYQHNKMYLVLYALYYACDCFSIRGYTVVQYSATCGDQSFPVTIEVFWPVTRPGCAPRRHQHCCCFRVIAARSYYTKQSVVLWFGVGMMQAEQNICCCGRAVCCAYLCGAQPPVVLTVDCGINCSETYCQVPGIKYDCVPGTVRK